MESYTDPVLRYIHTLSAALFYILGSSFFLSYILMHNDIAPDAASGWLSIADIPLLFSGLLYGGLSVYLSIQDEAKPSRGLMIAIGVPLTVIFLVLLIVNFL